MPIKKVIEAIQNTGKSYPLHSFFRNDVETAKKLMCIGAKINSKSLEILQEQQLLLALLDIFKDALKNGILSKLVSNELVRYESFAKLDTYMPTDKIKGSPPNAEELCFAISHLLDLSQLKYENLFREKQSHFSYYKEALELFPNPKETPYAQAKQLQSHKPSSLISV